MDGVAICSDRECLRESVLYVWGVWRSAHSCYLRCLFDIQVKLSSQQVVISEIYWDLKPCIKTEIWEKDKTERRTLSTAEPKACQHLEFWKRRGLYQKDERQGLWRRMKSRSVVVSRSQRRKFFQKQKRATMGRKCCCKIEWEDWTLDCVRFRSVLSLSAINKNTIWHCDKGKQRARTVLYENH